MNTKECLHCQKEFTPKRSTAKFCSSTCRAQYWTEKNKTEKPPDQDSPPPLKETGKIDRDKEKMQGETYAEMEIDVESYLLLLNWESWFEKCDKAINVLIKPSQHKIPLDEFIFVGDPLGSLLIEPYKNFKKRLNKIGLFQFTRTPINMLNIASRQRFQEFFYDQKQLAKKTINKMKENDPNNKGVGVHKSNNMFSAGDADQSSSRYTDEANSKSKKASPDKQDDKNTPKGKIISSTQLGDLKYETLYFNNKWKEFLGHPPVDFNCVIHGMPGEGKSTFAIQFANYLAKNFGKVVYISGEEGFSKTLKDKFFNSNAITSDLFIADIKKYEEIYKEVKTNAYNFIFIDSLDTMGIDAKKLRDLREHYVNIALITISQSTKDGKIRGSNEIVHDTDIAIKVENGMAVTTKNRMGEKNKKFDVFEEFEKEA